MDIKDAGIDDLLEEAMMRCDAAIFVGLQKNYETPDSSKFILRTLGYPELVMGMGFKAINTLANTEYEKAFKEFGMRKNKDIID